MNERNKRLLKKVILENDEKAFIELFNANENLIHSYIRKNILLHDQKKFKALYNEYYSLGRIALVKAIKTFDINEIEKVSFSNYATICIRNEILSYINNELKIKTRFNFISLNTPVNENNEIIDTDSEELIDNSFNPYHVLEEKDYQEYKKKRVKEAIKKLKEKEITALKLYCGYDDNVGKNVNEVAIRMNISASYANKLIISARKKLREELKDIKLCYREQKKKKIICKLS